MNSDGDSTETKSRIIDAIRETWATHPDEVAEFGLEALGDRIRSVASGWTVPVITRVENGSAYRLIQVLNALQESLEKSTNLWITLYLDPFADTTKNGDN
ncbi:MAG: hypothetical protein R3B68_07745 [Phycisphaerales bacterium]